MAGRPIANGVISFGLVAIPVRLFGVTSSHQISFNLLHAKDKSRIQQKIYCAVDDAIVDRSELVRGYEVEKGRYVTFTDEELKALEANGGDHTIDIAEFIALDKVDPVYFENAYYLGCEVSSAKAYRLLAEAMAESQRAAVARFTMRGKEHLVLLRPYAQGLMMHTMYYADEVRSVEDVDRGLNLEVRASELELAKRLIGELTSTGFEPDKYHDSYRERVEEAARGKLEGQEVVETAPQAQRGQVIDLMSALKASLEKRGLAAGSAGATAPAAEPEERKPARAKTSEKRRAGGRK